MPSNIKRVIMKYARLSKEQFEALNQEFATFLATQSIDKNTWDVMKENNITETERQLDLFSEIIWERVLSQTQYLEHFSKNQIVLFHCLESQIKSYIITTLDDKNDFLTVSGLEWLVKNLFEETVEIRIGKRDYNSERNLFLFQIIKEGAILSDGKFYNQLHEILSKN